jgi:CheY-like chemotaxis protein
MRADGEVGKRGVMAETPEAPETQSVRRVVVADDEDDVRLLFEQRFRRERRAGDLEFEFAGSGEEALALLTESGGTAALILSDINMPGMNGFQLLERIHAEWPDLDVYLVTAYDSDDYRQQASERGATGYFTKPLDFAELKRVLTT